MLKRHQKLSCMGMGACTAASSDVGSTMWRASGGGGADTDMPETSALHRFPCSNSLFGRIGALLVGRVQVWVSELVVASESLGVALVPLARRSQPVGVVVPRYYRHGASS